MTGFILTGLKTEADRCKRT